MKPYRYANPFRRNYEAAAACVWLGACVVLVITALTSPLPAVPFVVLAVVALLMATVRAAPALRLRATHRRLAGHPLSFTGLADLRKAVDARPDHLWLGKGFNWAREHSQLVADIERADPERVAPRDTDIMGQRWIHGLGEGEDDIWFPIKAADGHTLLSGTTGSGKTQLGCLIVGQHVMRRAQTAPEPLIVCDPKNDPALLETIRRAAVLVGREDDLFVFNPSFPARSVRIDPLRNWNRPTELATRIAALIPSETGSDAFTAFGQMALNAIVGGLLIAHQKPSLVLLRRYLEGEPEQLLIRSFSAYFAQHFGAGYTAELKPYTSRVKDAGSAQELARAHIAFYRERVQGRWPSTDLEGLIGFIEKNREWVGKMLGSLMPVLHLLTSGSLGALLSPDTDDLTDGRPICDFARIIRNREIFVAQLSSLEDSMTASAIGSLLISDLQSVAGAIYSYETKSGQTPAPVNLYVDELEAMVTDPMISLLNRSRGAGFRIVVATQNALPDLAARFGSEHKARMVLGNLNNLVSLRVKDAVTQQYVTENFGQTVVFGVQRSQSTTSGSEDPTDFKGSVSEALTEKDADRVPPQLLNALPNLEYIANLSAGRIVKGRFPIIEHGDAPAAPVRTPGSPRPLPAGALTIATR